MKIGMMKGSVLRFQDDVLQVICHDFDHFLMLGDETEVLFVQFVHDLPQAYPLLQLKQQVVET